MQCRLRKDAGAGSKIVENPAGVAASRSRTGKLLQRVAARAVGFMSPRVQSADFAHELRATGPVTMAVILLTFKSPTPICSPGLRSLPQNPDKINRLCSE